MHTYQMKLVDRLDGKEYWLACVRGYTFATNGRYSDDLVIYRFLDEALRDINDLPQYIQNHFNFVPEVIPD